MWNVLNISLSKQELLKCSSIIYVKMHYLEALLQVLWTQAWSSDAAQSQQTAFHSNMTLRQMWRDVSKDDGRTFVRHDKSSQRLFIKMLQVARSRFSLERVFIPKADIIADCWQDSNFALWIEMLSLRNILAKGTECPSLCLQKSFIWTPLQRFYWSIILVWNQKWLEQRKKRAFKSSTHHIYVFIWIYPCIGLKLPAPVLLPRASLPLQVEEWNMEGSQVSGTSHLHGQRSAPTSTFTYKCVLCPKDPVFYQQSQVPIHCILWLQNNVLTK